MLNHPRKLIAFFLFLCGLTLIACSKPEDKIVGVWTVDVDSTVGTDDRLKAMPEEQRKMAMDMARGLFKDSTFEFTKDGKMIANMAGKKEEGSYAVKSAEGDKLVLATKDKTGKDDDMTAQAKDGKLYLGVSGQTLVLNKK